MFRQAAIRHARLFSTSPAFRKGPVETAKDAAKAVDRTVSDVAVKGIEKGEEVAQAAKEATGVGMKKAEEAGSEVSTQAQKAKLEAENKAKQAKVEAEKKM